MNHTLYQQLAPLGFADWLEKKLNDNEVSFDNSYFEQLDKEDINDWGRTAINALAFRWLREKGIIAAPCFRYDDKISFEIYDKNTNSTYLTDKVNSYELAEHEALNKCLEILEGGEDE